MLTTHYVGLDIHKKTFMISICQGETEVPRRLRGLCFGMAVISGDARRYGNPCGRSSLHLPSRPLRHWSGSGQGRATRRRSYQP
jgi:hypothetical protein